MFSALSDNVKLCWNEEILDGTGTPKRKWSMSEVQ
jgi:hypothetical protein